MLVDSAASRSIIFSYDRSIVNTRNVQRFVYLVPRIYSRLISPRLPITRKRDRERERERILKKNGNGSFGSRTRRRAARFVFVELILVKSRLQNKPCDTVYIGLGRVISPVSWRIPFPLGGKASTRKREGTDCTWMHPPTRSVCFFLTFVVNIVVERGPPGRYIVTGVHGWYFFPNENTLNWLNRKITRSKVSKYAIDYIYWYLKYILSKSTLRSFKFPWKIYSESTLKLQEERIGFLVVISWRMRETVAKNVAKILFIVDTA